MWGSVGILPLPVIVGKEDLYSSGYPTKDRKILLVTVSRRSGVTYGCIEPCGDHHCRLDWFSTTCDIWLSIAVRNMCIKKKIYIYIHVFKHIYIYIYIDCGIFFCDVPILWARQGFPENSKNQKIKNEKKLYLHRYIYLEPKWPLFWLEKALFWGVDLQK